MVGQRVVVARRWTGLGDCVVSLLAALGYARATNRGLIADWRYSAYTLPGRNLFSRVFEPATQLGGVPFLGDDGVHSLRLAGPFWPAGWTSQLLHEPPWQGERGDTEQAVLRIRSGEDVVEPVVVFDGCLSAAAPSSAECRSYLGELRPHGPLRHAADAFVASHFRDRPVLGLHVRHGNGDNLMGHARYWEKPGRALMRILDATQRSRAALRVAIGEDPVVFLCTDSAPVESAIRRAVPTVLTRPKAFRPAGEGALHVGPEARDGIDDAAIEMMLLGEVDVLVRFPPESFFSFWGATMKRACPLALPESPPDGLAPLVC